MSEIISTSKSITKVKKSRKVPEERKRTDKPEKKGVKRAALPDSEQDQSSTHPEAKARQRLDTDELISFCYPRRRSSGSEPSAKKRRRRPRNSIELYMEAANIDSGGGDDGKAEHKKL